MNRDGIDSKTLLVIAGRLGNDWKKLAIHLGFEDEDISDFEVNNQGNVHQQRFKMLTKWRQRQPSTEGQMGVLCRALKDIERNDIVILLQGRIRRPTEISGPTLSENCQQQPTRHYKETTNTIHAHTLEPARPVAMGGFHSNFGLTQGMYTLAQIPIIILLLCTVWENLSKLLGRLTELFTYFVKVLVSRRCNEVIPAHPLDSSRTLAMVGFEDPERTQGLKVGIEDPILSNISEMLGDDWKKLAIHLGFDEAKIRTFEGNNPRDVHHQKFKMLTEWRQRQPSNEGQMDVLCRALTNINRNDIVVWLQGRPVISGLTPLEYCQQQLTQHYKDTTSTIPAHPADPSRTLPMGRFYYDLELTKKLKGKQTSQERTQLKGETRILDQVRTVPLDLWDDLLNTDIVGSLRIIVSGGAGFGKSTLLLRVANASIDPKLLMAKFKLVFLVLLRGMQESSCVLKAIFDQIIPINTQLRKADLKKIIDDNETETLILLDGLDEIPSSVLNSRAHEGEYGVKDILENRVWVKSSVIVTTRPHMIDYALEKYPHFACVQTHGFTLKTANKYIADYFAENVSLGDTLESNLKSNNSLQTLAKIPIMVLFLCIVWENLSKLPDRLTQLYTQFAEVLVSRRCNEGEDQLELRKSVMRGLGRVALDGLLDPNGERLTFSSGEFDKKDLEDGCRLGFLQEESIMSGLEKITVVTFLHKSFQEFSAADYLASLYSLKERRFHDELKRINADNVHAMKDLLRFTCGISSESPATGFILEHVRELKNREELGLQGLARVLLFESSSSKWACKLERPTEVDCHSHEDLKALQYYVQCVPLPPVQIEESTVDCRSCDDITILKDILLSDKITHTFSLFDRFRAGSGDASLPSWLRCRYTMADRVSDAMQILEETLQGMDERIRDRLELDLTIDKSSCFDDECVLRHLPYVSNQVGAVFVFDRSYNDVSRLTNALQGCSRLWWVESYDTNLHNNVQCLASLISPSLWRFSLERCGLDDDDIPDLIRIIPTGHNSLCTLDVQGNAFSVHGWETLCTHLQSLPDLTYFVVGYTNDESLKSMVKQYLPNVHLV